MTATLCGPGGVREVIAEHLLLKQQLLVLHRPRQRAPHLTASDRRLFGFGSLFLSPEVWQHFRNELLVLNTPLFTDVFGLRLRADTLTLTSRVRRRRGLLE